MQRLLKASVLIAAIALVTASLVTADTTKQNLIDEWNAKGNPTVKFAVQADVNETEPLNDNCPGESFTPGDVYHGELTADDCDWVEFSCNAGDQVVIETGPDGGLPTVDTFLELYSDNCNFFETSNDDGGAGLYSRIEGTILVDATFQVKVRGFSGASTGFYQLSITCTPPPPPNGNDSCEVAINVPRCQPFTDQGDLTSNQNNYSPGVFGASCTGFSADGPDGVYCIDMLAGDLVNIDYLSDGDGSLYIITDCDDPVGSCVAGADDTLTGELESIVGFVAPVDGTYYVIADNFGPGGPYSIVFNFDCPTSVEPTSVGAIKTRFDAEDSDR